ncbi:MAG: haloacid dehalogenase type II, partial [Thermoleophilaceae bacterium]
VKAKVATFDCYGTLIDWEGGAAAFLYDLARRQGDADPGPGRLLRERWEEIQFEALQGKYRSYSEVLSSSLRTWTAARGYRWNFKDGEAFEKAMQSWQPFPDTVPALQRAQKAGLRLVIISNTDNHIMQRTLQQLAPLEFDAVVTAEDLGVYKPDTTAFTRALAAAAAPPEEILHVAFGYKYDIRPAQEVGMQTAWINRHREEAPGEAKPDYEWRDLWGLAELAESG